MNIEEILLNGGWTKTNQIPDVWKIAHWEKTVSEEAHESEAYYYANPKKAYGIQMKLNSICNQKIEEE